MSMHAWPGMVGWLAGVIYLLPLTQARPAPPRPAPPRPASPARACARSSVASTRLALFPKQNACLS